MQPHDALRQLYTPTHHCLGTFAVKMLDILSSLINPGPKCPYYSALSLVVSQERSSSLSASGCSGISVESFGFGQSQKGPVTPAPGCSVPSLHRPRMPAPAMRSIRDGKYQDNKILHKPISSSCFLHWRRS